MDSYFVLVRTRQHDRAPDERVSLVIKDPAEYLVSSIESKLYGYSELLPHLLQSIARMNPVINSYVR